MIINMKIRRIIELTTLTVTLTFVGCDNQEQGSGQEPIAQSQSTATEVSFDQVPHPAAGKGTTPGDWDAYGADISSTKYTPLDQINGDNIDQLEIAWRRPALDDYYVNLNPRQRYSTRWNAAPIVKWCGLRYKWCWACRSF